MTVVRTPAVAGRFYPDDPGELRSTIESYLATAVVPVDSQPPRALIVPHAGYPYSGPVAATAYARLRPLAERIERVVLLGPCHRVPLEGLARSSADVFETPLGSIPVDTAAIERLGRLPCVQHLEAAHAGEHSLEVHLPFLQVVLGEFVLVPLVVGQAAAADVAAVLREFADDPATLTVVSSDLSHFHDYDTAVRLDAATAQHIERGEAGALRGDRACGCVPIAGLLDVARERGWVARAVDLRNSGDTGGPRDRVVGYGAFVLTDGERERPAARGEAGGTYSAEERRTLLEVARWAIRTGLDTGVRLEPDPAPYPPRLRDVRATFVTLRIEGALRGCMGSLEASRPLVADVAHNAFSAAFEDPRFEGLAATEYDRLDVHVSVLSAAEPFPVESEEALVAGVRPGVDGLILVEQSRRGTFLPSVWEILPEPAEFVRALKKKAGLPEDYWSETLRVFRYTTESFGS